MLLLLSAAFLFGGNYGVPLRGKTPCIPIHSFFLESRNPGDHPTAIVARTLACLSVAHCRRCAGYVTPSGSHTAHSVFLRGLFLSYGLVALIGSTSGAEILCTMVILGPTCLLTIPILFVLGTAGLLRSTESSPSSRIRRALCCVSGLVLCVFLDQAVVPQLLTVLLKGFTATAGSG